MNLALLSLTITISFDLAWWLCTKTIAASPLSSLLATSLFIWVFCFSSFIWSPQCDSSSTFRQIATTSGPMSMTIPMLTNIRKHRLLSIACRYTRGLRCLTVGWQGVRGRRKKSYKKTMKDEYFRQLNEMLFVLLAFRYLLFYFMYLPLFLHQFGSSKLGHSKRCIVRVMACLVDFP